MSIPPNIYEVAMTSREILVIRFMRDLAAVRDELRHAKQRLCLGMSPRYNLECARKLASECRESFRKLQYTRP